MRNGSPSLSVDGLSTPIPDFPFHPALENSTLLLPLSGDINLRDPQDGLFGRLAESNPFTGYEPNPIACVHLTNQKKHYKGHAKNRDFSHCGNS